MAPDTGYHSSIYARSNDLTEEGFRLTSKSYELDYGPWLPKDPSAAILDVGCGGGQFLWHLEQKGYRNISGVDMAPDQIEQCAKRTRAKLQVADAVSFVANAKRSYDAIVANDFVEHLDFDKLAEFLGYVRAALKPGGVFLARTINCGNPLGLNSRYRDLTHRLGFTEISLEQVFRTAGFAEVHVVGGSREFPSTLRGKIARLLSPVVDACLKALFSLYGFEPPKIFAKLLVGVGREAA